MAALQRAGFQLGFRPDFNVKETCVKASDITCVRQKPGAPVLQFSCHSLLAKAILRYDMSNLEVHFFFVNSNRCPLQETPQKTIHSRVF